MVRVISVHHFANQHVQIVEQPTACTVAPPNRLLLALMSNVVEVRDLSNDSEILFSFPTVDEVAQIVHCLNSDYVATLEMKFNRQNKEIGFVRVYINWDSVAALQQSKMTSSGVSLGSSECGMVQPMRARIAGRVTPTTNQSELGSLEMIEIPVKLNPSLIDCCQISGNLLILSGNVINIHAFKIKTHDISKLRFVDFAELQFLIELSFTPTQVSFCENYIACCNKENMHLFKVLKYSHKLIIDDNELTDDEVDRYDGLYNVLHQAPVDYKKLLREEIQKSTRERITVNLPSINKENSIVHRSSPFTFSDKDMTAEVKPNQLFHVSAHCRTLIKYDIVNLIQMRLIPVLIESAQRQVTEEFKSMILKPLYVDQCLNKESAVPDQVKKFLRSENGRCLNSVVCVVATQQEGYLYHFDDFDPGTDRDNCLAIYPFTAPVFKLVMEDYFLHALTETGLESYTFRYGHQMCRNIEVVDDVNVACPPINDPICLVGLRPFLGVELILLAENYLVLLANSETSPAHSDSSNSSSNASFLTLYSLQLPSPKTIFNDISSVANVHRFTSVNTYCHLMSEAHMVLRMELLLKKWTVTDDSSVKLIVPDKTNVNNVIDVYRVSCALLGDHFIMENAEEEYMLAVPYYKMARVSACEVLKRIKKIHEQSGNQSTKGVVFYLKKVLLDIRSGPDADKLFGSNSKQFFTDSVLELLEHHNYKDLPNLILKSRIMREYSVDKLLHILVDKMSDNLTNLSEKYLATAILYIQKCNTGEAQEHLKRIRNNDLCNLLLEHHDLLFETTHGQLNRNKPVMTFSELSVLLISLWPELLACLLVNLMIEKKVISLNKVLKVFLEYLPSSIGTNSNVAGSVLQKTLEMYFERHFSKPENVDLNKIIYERGATEAVKLLVRSYLSQLQIIQLKEETSKKEESTKHKMEKDLIDDVNDDSKKGSDQEKLCYNPSNKHYFEEQAKQQKSTYLFSNVRHQYLDRMPPFQVEVTSKLYEACLDNYSAKEQFQPNVEADLVLKKIQALLCSQVIPKQVMTEVNGFLAVNENLRGSVSLQSITMSASDAVILLIDACPQCLTQFGKDRFSKTDEWKFLIATVQRRILRLSQNERLDRVCFFHKKILNDILTYAASSMTMEDLVQVFPQRFDDDEINKNEDVSEGVKLPLDYNDRDQGLLNEIQNYEPYIVICKETMHANQMKQLILTTGHQLLLTLNF